MDLVLYSFLFLSFLNFFGTRLVLNRYKAIIYFSLSIVTLTLRKEGSGFGSNEALLYFFTATALSAIGGLYIYLFKYQNENPEDLNDFDD